jgi:hypothetical protein
MHRLLTLQFARSGIAGGTPPKHEGPGVAVFTGIGYAQQGSLGSQVLKKGPAQEVWNAGSAVEVAWGIRYNVRPRDRPVY